MFLRICGCQNDVFLYFYISETLKPYGMKWLKPLFHVFQDLAITYPQKKNCVVPRWSQQQVPARPRSTGRGTPPVLPSHPLCAGLWSFSFSDSIYQPSSHPLHSPEQWQPDTFCGFTLWSNLHPIAGVQAVQLGSPVAEWHCCDTMMVMWNSNPTGGTASIWKRTKLESIWMMLISVLTISKKQGQYLTFWKDWRYSFFRACKY